MEKLWQTKRREILAGAACLLVLFAVFLLMPERDVPTEESEIGTVRIAEVLAAHPSYERLKALRAEERTLTLLLRDLPKTPEIKPPETDPAPFEDSVWQKNAQVVISTRVELEREQKRLAEVYRKQTQADYEARKKAIDDEYLNAILNINLKIDNQRAMHGPQVSEEELARERAMRQRELYRQWEAEINARVAARIEPQQAAWTKRAQETVDAQKAEAERMKKEVQERSAQEMERARAAQEGKSTVSARAMRLAAVRAEADALEAEIMRDVRSRAAKLALQHQLSLILASPEADAMMLLPSDDLTAEMVREMERIEPTAAQ